jgi:hypothetical protein
MVHELILEIVGEHAGKKLTHLLGTGKGFVSQICSGETLPSDLTLAVIATEYAPDRLNELLVAAALDRALKKPSKSKPTLDAQTRRELNARRDKAMRALEVLQRSARGAASSPATPVKTSGRTLNDFPGAFYPLAIVTGDRREESGSHISAADLGAYAATPADTRWIESLELRGDVVKHIDKNFVLQPEDRLIERFANVNLLVVGSPAANHLARMINGSAVFRFNYEKDAGQGIENVIEQAKELTAASLVAFKQTQHKALRHRMQTLFTGGIFDPMHPPQYVTAHYARIVTETQLDFGILTFAANPFYEASCRKEGRAHDYRYVSIMAAGIHHPATAHALRRLSKENRNNGVFNKHPYGGVLRVVLDLRTHFTERTEQATCDWEDRSDDARTESLIPKQDLVNGLADIEHKRARGELGHLAISSKQAMECRRLVESL